MVEGKSQIDKIVSRLGEKVKLLRAEKDWSLKDLSRRSGISAAAVHKIESNGITPTITTMMKIADALGKRVSYFIEEYGENEDVFYVSARNRDPIFTFKKGLNLDGISAKQYGDFIMTAAYARVEVGASSGSKPMSHRGEELIYCLQGKMEFRVKNKTYVLEPGDSLHFRTHHKHKWKNVSNIQSKLIWILSISSS